MLFDPKSLFGFESFQCKFIRVGNEIYVTKPDDITTLHSVLAEKDKILSRVEHLKEQSRDEVDGGLLFVSGKTIQVGSASTSLSVPLTNRAREITLQKLKNQIPDYSLKQVGEV